jgi:hypothetical protein
LLRLCCNDTKENQRTRVALVQRHNLNEERRRRKVFESIKLVEIRYRQAVYLAETLLSLGQVAGSHAELTIQQPMTNIAFVANNQIL